MKNKLQDLNDHLFAALERVNDEDLKDAEAIKAEVARAKAVVDLSGQIIDSRRVTVEAAKLVYDATGALPNGASARLLPAASEDA